MKFTKLKLAGLAAGVAALSFVTTPANAIGITDASGVDFDAACLLYSPLASVGGANETSSPGTNPKCLLGVYDGDTESTDLRTVDLSSSGGQLVASFTADGTVPAAGSTTPPQLGGANLPNNNLFVGLGYKAMFQNPNQQTNTPYQSATRVGTGTPIFGLNEHHEDGFHFFVGFDAVWDGNNWLHSAQIGTYDVGPDGGFLFDELGVSNSPGVWTDDDPTCFSRAAGNWDVVYGPGNTVTVKVKGVVSFSNVQAVGGCDTARYAVAGDSITNIKGWSTADFTVTLPVTIPLSLIPGFSDLTSVGGLIFPSDTTDGNSRNFGLNATLATATGDLVGTPCNNEGLLGNRMCISYTSGLFGISDKSALLASNFPPDTLGDGFRCWTSTVGGLLPANPLWVPNQPCYIDDDNIPNPLGGNIDPGERGTLLAEFWDTNYSFTF